MALGFIAYPDGSGAFDHEVSTADSGMLLADLEERAHSGALSEKAYVAELTRQLDAAPDSLAIHLQLAVHWLDERKPKKALDAALLGLAVANRAIPEGFAGTLSWGHIENRAYLRLMHVAALSALRLRRHKDAVALMTQMLERNPDDNQGIRLLLGSAALRAGDGNLAREVFEREAPQYAPYWYELALCRFASGEYVAAATALRRGFAANPYIAEFIGGNIHPLPLPWWPESTHDILPEAEEYFAMFGAQWQADPTSVLFAHWLFNHPQVLRERAVVQECHAALSGAAGTRERMALQARLEQGCAGIDDVLSAELVSICRHWTDGTPVLPWLQVYR